MRYILKKLGVLIATLLIVTLLAFIAFQIIPGDPVVRMLGTEYTETRAEELRTELGLDKPWPERYANWVLDFAAGDMGTSYSYNEPVRELISGRIPATFTLTAMAFLMIVVVSVPLGVFVARYESSWLDRVFTIINQITMSIPPFFLGIILVYIFGYVLKLFTHGAYVSYAESIAGFIGYLICPAIAIALPKCAMTIKLLRSAIIGEMDSDYVRTAYSKGNTKSSVLYRHVLRNAVIPVITFVAMTIADIMAGSIIIEQVFGIPGMGRMLLSSIGNRDYPVVQAIVVIIASVVVIVNFIVDIVYQYTDPRIKL